MHVCVWPEQLEDYTHISTPRNANEAPAEEEEEGEAVATGAGAPPTPPPRPGAMDGWPNGTITTHPPPGVRVFCVCEREEGRFLRFLLLTQQTLPPYMKRTHRPQPEPQPLLPVTAQR